MANPKRKFSAAKPEPPRPARKRVSRSRSARHLLTRAQLQQSLAIDPPPSLKNTTIAGFQAALTVLLAMSLIYISPWSHLVGFPALGALAALFGRYASFRRRRTITWQVGVLLVAGVFLTSLISLTGASRLIMVLVLAVFAGIATIAVSRLRLGAPGAVILVFAVGASLSSIDSWTVIVERTVATTWGALLAWLICAATDRLRTEDVPVAGAPPAKIPRLKSQLIAGSRITLGAALAGLIAYWAGWQYPAWAAIGATAVMQGRHLHVTMSRALQRMAGTVVGGCVAWAILAHEPSFWYILAAIVFFQFVTEIIIPYNYAIGQITITPMALLMTYLVAPVTEGNLPVERVLDTIVGAAIGIVLAVIFSTADDRVYLARRSKKLRARM